MDKFSEQACRIKKKLDCEQTVCGIFFIFFGLLVLYNLQRREVLIQGAMNQTMCFHCFMILFSTSSADIKTCSSLHPLGSIHN